MINIKQMNDYTHEVCVTTGDGYDLIYRRRGITLPPSPIKWLHRYVLHKGNYLWCVKATDIKTRKPNFYFVVAKNKTNAREKFKDRVSWLPYITSIEQLTGDLAEQILGNAQQYSVF